MYFELEKFAVKNLMSIGNSIVEIDFTKGFSRISGVSGAGKSVLEDGITYNLYGKVLKKMRLASLINKKNKSNLWTCSTFRSGHRRFRVTRGAKPDIFEIEEWVGNGWSTIPEASSKSGHQAFLTRMIGISFDIFRQVVILTVSKTSQNFIDMEAKDRRQVVSNIFNLHIVDELKEIASMELKTLNLAIEVSTSSVALLNSSLDKLTLSANSLRNRDEDAVNARLAVIKDTGLKLVGNVKILKENLQRVSDDFSTKNLLHIKSLESIGYENSLAVSGQRQLLERQLNQLKAELQETKKSIGSKCSYCGQTMSEEHLASESEKLKGMVRERETAIEVISEHDKVVANGNVLIEKFKLTERSYLSQKATIEADLKNANAYIQSLKSEAIEIKAKLNEPVIDDVFSQQINLTKSEINSAEDLLKNQIDRKETLGHLLKHVFHDNGVKANYLNNYIEPLNELINKYATAFNLPFLFTFDTSFNITIESTLNGGQEFEYGQMSEGQMKRLDIAISLSFIEIMKTVANWDSNLLMLDEILDRGLDPESMNSVIDALKKIQIEQEKSIWIISHKEIDARHFDRNIHVHFMGGFSHYEFS